MEDVERVLLGDGGTPLQAGAVRAEFIEVNRAGHCAMHATEVDLVLVSGSGLGWGMLVGTEAWSRGRGWGWWLGVKVGAEEWGQGGG